MRLHEAYEVLGVTPAAEPAEVRAAFRRLVQQRHPDTGATTGTEASVREVIEAYRVLADHARVADRSVDDPPPMTERGHRIPVQHVGPIPRPSVGASGDVCGVCGGAGRQVTVVGCGACAGTGEITALGMGRARRLACRVCGGRGRRRLQTRCGRCDGTGTTTR